MHDLCNIGTHVLTFDLPEVKFFAAQGTTNSLNLLVNR